MLPGSLLLSRMLLEDMLLDEIVVGSTLLEPLDQDFEHANKLVDTDQQSFVQQNELQNIRHLPQAAWRVVAWAKALACCYILLAHPEA